MHRLSRFSVLAFAVAILCAFAGSVLADGGSFTGSTLVIPEKSVIPQKVANLTYYTDRATFEAAAPDLKKEDFEGGTTPPGGLAACGSPVDSNPSPCFPAGIESGLEVHASSETNVVALGPGVVPINPTTWVGSDLFNDFTFLEFTDPDVFAAGFDVFDFFGSPTITMKIYSAAGLEGTAIALSGGFFGVVSDTPITTIVMGTTTNVVVLDNVCFGNPVLDSDGDGVVDDDDVCDDTVIPEGVPTVRLGKNRFALVDGDGVFDTNSPNGNGPGRSYTIEDTAGCSCEQIIVAQGLGNGHRKFGCSISAMDDWVTLVNP